MFRITEDPSSGSLVQCLAKNYKNGSIVSVDVDKFGVMAAYAAIPPTYESEPPLKPSPLTCYKQFGTNAIIVLMFVESQRVHI